MITSDEQAIEVQSRRFKSGKKGRSKAVRNWVKRTYGGSISIHGNLIIKVSSKGGEFIEDYLLDHLKADFTGCRPYSEG